VQVEVAVLLAAAAVALGAVELGGGADLLPAGAAVEGGAGVDNGAVGEVGDGLALAAGRHLVGDEDALGVLVGLGVCGVGGVGLGVGFWGCQLTTTQWTTTLM